MKPGPTAVSLMVALSVVALLLACASPAASPPTGGPSEWNVVVSEKTGGADPLSEYGTNAQYFLIPYVMEPLVRVEMLPDGKSWGVVNVLADKWSFPDKTTFLVELKKGVKFHNGEELTSEHVQFAYDTLVSSEGRKGPPLKPMGKSEIVDKYTIRWRMPAPDISVLGVLQQNLLIPSLERKRMTAEEYERKPIGTGPYKVIEWPRDGTVKLQAWEGYRMGKAVPDKLVIRTVLEPSTRVLELTAGTAQIGMVLPIESITSVQANPKLDVVSLQGSFTLSYVINIFKTTPPLRDKRIRQAMNYAVDRESIVKAILGGRGAPLPGPLWPGYLGHTEDAKPYPYDPEKAKALLKEAGHPDGFSFKWTVTQGVYPKDIEIAQAVANQLAKVGINAELKVTERARLLTERNAGDYDVTELRWSMYWIPAVVLSFTLDASYPDARLAPTWGPTPLELARAREFVKAAGAATSIEQMAQGYEQVNRVMHDEAFWLFVHTVDEVWGIQKDIGWRPYPNAYAPLYDYWGMIGQKAPSNTIIPLVLK